MKQFFIIIMMMTVSVANGQYISGITKADSLAEVVTDVSDLSVKFANTITADKLREHLTIIASDEFEGRETGTIGNNKASKYIRDYFNSINLSKPQATGSFYQNVDFTFSKWVDTDIFVNNKRFKHLWDYISFPNKNQTRPLLETDEVLFLGYGIDDAKYSDYKKVKEKDLEGKVIMIYKGEPMKKDSTYYITKSNSPSDWSNNLDRKLAVAKEKGVALVLIIEDDIKAVLGANRHLLLGPVVEMGDKSNEEVLGANYCLISTSLAKEIIGENTKKVVKARDKINKKGKNKRELLKANFVINQSKDIKIINSKNIAGIVPGYGEEQEFIVVSAHYDHLGKKGDDIYNGADDNGSGTSSVLALAEAFSKANFNGAPLKRSIMFILFTGEEKGLLGSEYYTQNPLVPLEKTIANVNIDMVGRVDEKYKDNPNYIYVIGSDRISQDLHDKNEEANKKYSNLTLDYTYNSEEDPNRYYYRSDHYNFAKNGIPSIFFFNGTHEDYHRPSDTVEKINFEKMEKVDRHIFHLLWNLANDEEQLKIHDKE